MIIYSLGAIVTFAFLLYKLYKMQLDIYISDLLLMLFVSITSWLGLFIFIGTHIYEFIEKTLDEPIITWKSQKKNT